MFLVSPSYHGELQSVIFGTLGAAVLLRVSLKRRETFVLLERGATAGGGEELRGQGGGTNRYQPTRSVDGL